MLPTYPSEDRDHVYEQARPFVAQYLSVPAYAELQRRFGRGYRLAPVWEAWARRDYAGAAAALDPELIDELVIHGSPASCRRQIAEFARLSGATPLVIPMGDHAPLRERALSLAPDAG
jgi:alkanesulfonate monooxygenase SsuD/methylene tetrahydromethanopterin reductase-like flavin-dependent oxidoreductase (luciferase family)